MNLLQTIASNHDFRNPAANARRTQSYRDLLAIAGQQRARLLLLPGGFWTVDRPAKVEPLVDQLAEMAAAVGVVVIAGVDIEGKNGKSADLKGSRAPDLPYFGFVGGLPAARPIWQQSSSTRTNAWDVPDEDVPGAGRIVQVDGISVGVLICGELFSERARNSIANQSPGLLVDLGHTGMGQGLQRAMANAARLARCPFAHSQHVASWWQPSLHFASPDGEPCPRLVSSCEWVGDDEFWVGWCVRSV